MEERKVAGVEKRWFVNCSENQNHNKVRRKIRNVIYYLALAKSRTEFTFRKIVVKMSKSTKSPKSYKQQLVEENQKLQSIKKNMSNEQRDLRAGTRELKKLIKQKEEERDLLIQQRIAAMNLHLANPA